MKTKVIWALGALNVLLGVALFTPVVSPARAAAAAQTGGARPSDYLMIPGEVVGGSTAVIWLIDGKNQQLSAMTVDENRQRVDMMAPVPLDRLFNR